MLDLIEQRRTELKGLCRRYGVVRLELFGSAADGTFNTATSDLDFLVEFTSLSPCARADAYFGLLHGLEDLFQCKIDLMTNEARRNPWLVRSVDPQRKLLYAA
jgi:predicted nucleotidyltransferase